MTSRKVVAPPVAAAPPGRLFRITYSCVRPDEDPQLFKDRDSLAFCELAAPFLAAGYTYGTTVYLYPDDERALSEFPAFQASDILVLTTRPPLDDNPRRRECAEASTANSPPAVDALVSRRRKVIYQAGARVALETVLFAEFDKYFAYCNRKHVELSDHGFQLLRAEDRRRWRHVELFEYLGPARRSSAEVQKHYVGPETVLPAPNGHSSIAFFLRANGLPGINCDFVASFGMDAYGTLLWNRMIRTQFTPLVAAPGFVMAELVYKKALPVRPITPEFNDRRDYVDARLLT
jgi:hypothetical protein